MAKLRVLVTGANGFVGRSVCADLLLKGYHVVAAMRDSESGHRIAPNGNLDARLVGNICGETDWMSALSGCSTVIHLAARAHILCDTVSDPMHAFREINVAGSVQLAKSAMRAGVRRFIYVSSVGVNGRRTSRSFNETDAPAPVENYGRSKLEAELALRKLTFNSGMELVIVRPPLVYGPDCRGNFLRLLKLVATGLPLPFLKVQNSKSFISVWNLADFLATCVEHEKAANQMFLVSDMEDTTLPNLLRYLANGMGKQARLLPVNPRWLAGLARMFGKYDLYEKLCDSLTIDASHARQVLGWVPPVSLSEGLERTGRWYGENNT